MSLADAVISLKTGTYTVTRVAASTYDAQGHAVAGSESTLKITAAIQPTSGDELERLPEGMRTGETIAIYTKTPLITKSDTNGPDVVTYNGQDYEVVIVWNRGTFYKAIGSR